MPPGNEGALPPKTVIEPGRQLPVIGDCDVAVVGGGIAGVAAAVAAARSGASTALIEKESALGGLATLGNVVKYLPLCDGAGTQVIGGIAEELALLALRDGCAHRPACWEEEGDRKAREGARYTITFNPVSYLLELEQVVVQAGIDLWYDTRLCAVSKGGTRIEALIVENKSGRGALRCGVVVDASGDADVCALAGEATVSHSTNVACGWFHYAKDGQVHLQPLSRPFAFDPNELPEGVAGYSVIDGRDVTAQVLESRQLIRQRLAQIRTETPEAEVCPVFAPTIATPRMTRRLRAEVELTLDDAGRAFEDHIGVTGHWRKKGVIFEIPLRSLVAPRTCNLLAAGRCMSAAGECWDVMRVIAPCAVTGEAAGAAAALAAQDHASRVTDLPLPALQARLREQGAYLRR